MNMISKDFSRRAAAVAIHGALLALAGAGAARAEDADPAVVALTTPVNQVEVGLQRTSQDSYKFGEYNGDHAKGVDANGSFDLRGGGSYDSNDATRWRLSGRDLGLGIRSFSGEYGEQGKYRFNIAYDELYRARSDSYQTPFTGVGTGNLKLSSNWPIPVYTPGPTNGVNQAVSYANAKNLNAAELGDFHTVDLYTDRRKTGVGLTFESNRHWEWKASAEVESKEGLKPTGAVMTQTAPASGDKAMILPEPIQYKTYQLNASAAYSGEQAFFKAGYYGSLFRNAIKSLTFMDPFQQPNLAGSGAGVLSAGRLGTAPDNDYHQINFSGGYSFSPTTKLVAEGAYGQGRQDQSFLPADILNSATFALPRASLGGAVDTTTLSAKLTMKPTSRLNLAANLKYDDRHNKTPVSVYNMPADGDTGGTDVRSNTPYSKKIKLAAVEGDYLVARGKWIKAGVERLETDRTCDGTWFACSDAGKTTEGTYRLEFRTSMTDSLSGRVSYAYQHRTADAYNPDANILASIGPSPALTALVGQVTGTGNTFWGPASGAVVAGTGATAAAALAAAQAAYPAGSASLNFGGLSSAVHIGSTYYVYLLNSAVGKVAATGGVAPWIPAGMERFNLADRNRNKVRSSASYIVSDALSLQGGIDYSKDEYTNTTYGLKHGSNAAYNLDATFAPGEDFSTDLFATYEDVKQYSTGNAAGSNSVSTAASAQAAGSAYIVGNPAASCSYNTILGKNLNAKIDPCLQWSADIRDVTSTLGAAFKLRNRMGRKLDLGGNVIYSHARTSQGFTGGAYATPIGVA